MTTDMTKQNITTTIFSNCRGISKTTRIVGVKRIFLVAVATLLMTPITHAAQFGWPPVFGNKQNSRPATPTWFPFATPAQRQPARRSTPSMPFPWMGGSRTTATPQWNSYRAPSMPFGGQPGFSSFSNPLMGLGGLGSIGMMVTPMVGVMAPMMGNYAIASMNPTTMKNFFGLMSNQTTPWSQPAAPNPFGNSSSNAAMFPSFFPFFNQGGTRR